MCIFVRAAHNADNPFTQISNLSVFGDLSPAALGVLLKLLAVPDSWNITLSGTVGMFPASGIGAIRTIFRELMDKGFLKVLSERKIGKFGRVYELREVADIVPVEPTTIANPVPKSKPESIPELESKPLPESKPAPSSPESVPDDVMVAINSIVDSPKTRNKPALRACLIRKYHAGQFTPDKSLNLERKKAAAAASMAKAEQASLAGLAKMMAAAKALAKKRDKG